ncbi:carboxylating nicotinate-nucleotide diphosphorylase [uncultured Porphyromonas sp.]|uniref:carboxylating nicotinate-nucleotide diphosphorylase n=1 Tax=uncultured Porphyromonas sp. TaxID=159274 RepID=UPI0025CE28C6|nr:carboxylating nicotinate-nucleotide diphosphorylase [uncultured Porphyromonas sp.]
MHTYDIEEENLDRLIDLALDEDGVSHDLATLSIIPREELQTAFITAKADGIISGIEVARRLIEAVADIDEEVDYEPLVADGDHITKGQDLIRIRCTYLTLLGAERTMLNFLQRMSGIATATAQLVKLCEGTRAHVLDTRKTLPGHRLTDKMAVRHGGGYNHRLGLSDMCLLKDNHIKLAGSITAAVESARRSLPLSIKIEVETETLEQVEEAARVGADIIMLDNMSTEMMTEAVRLIDGRARTEASGNVSAETIRAIAECGVDYISVGALTHSVRALDISMNFGHKEKGTSDRK